jgi:hypothetical protein
VPGGPRSSGAKVAAHGKSPSKGSKTARAGKPTSVKQAPVARR